MTVIIIGAGHNGLVAACSLAQAGFKPLVLERRPIVGGAAITEEIHPGFRCSALAHAAGPLSETIAHDFQLARHGLTWIRPDPTVLALAPDGRGLRLHEDVGRTAGELAKLSEADARRYSEYHDVMARLGRLFASILSDAPPAIDSPGAGDWWTLLKMGRRFRALGRKNAHRLLRWAPMAVADLVEEWFENDLLRAAIAARGIAGAFAGPWSAGTALHLLLHAGLGAPPGGSAIAAKGGMGALTQALASAARMAGAGIRTGVEVESVRIRHGAANGVVLTSGEEVAADAVVSNADPKRTFLRLVDPIHLDPDFLLEIRNYRSVGTVAKVNLALSGLPTFRALAAFGAADARAALGGRIHIGPDLDYLERAFDAAKYGEISPQPFLDVAIPSLADPSLAPAGQHVMSIVAQCAPYTLKAGDWMSRRDELGDLVIRTLAAYAPDLPNLVVARQVVTPLDLEQTYGLTGGHIYHGEMSLDQLFTMRPLLGWARYRTPIRRLYLCGAGTHPGGGVTGLPGANAARQIVRDLKRGAGS